MESLFSQGNEKINTFSDITGWSKIQGQWKSKKNKISKKSKLESAAKKTAISEEEDLAKSIAKDDADTIFNTFKIVHGMLTRN